MIGLKKGGRRGGGGGRLLSSASWTTWPKTFLSILFIWPFDLTKKLESGLLPVIQLARVCCHEYTYGRSCSSQSPCHIQWILEELKEMHPSPVLLLASYFILCYLKCVCVCVCVCVVFVVLTLRETFLFLLYFLLFYLPDQAEKVWVEVLEELPRLPSLRPLLVRQLLRNASQETESLGPCLQSLKEERSLELDEARKNKQKCKVGIRGRHGLVRRMCVERCLCAPNLAMWYMPVLYVWSHT